MDLSCVLDLIPPHYVPYAMFFIIFCKILTIFWKPPVSDSPVGAMYRFINLIALNIGWATNHALAQKSSAPARQDPR